MNFQELNNSGLFPGPLETEEAFFRRVDYLLSLKTRLQSTMAADFPFEAALFAEEQETEEAYRMTSAAYGAVFPWVPVCFSNYQLAPWQGGCAWIFQLEENSPKGTLVQLRRPFRDSPSYLGIYKRKDLLAHEFCHAGRMEYEEPKFEEFLAYSSASRWFTRNFGPLLKSSFESVIFLIVVAALGMANLFKATVAPDWNGDFYATIFALLLFSLILVRLAVRHVQLERCRRALKRLLSDFSPAVNPLLYRLTDKEILAFGRMEPSQIEAYIETQGAKSFRWKFLKSIYLTKH